MEIKDEKGTETDIVEPENSPEQGRQYPFLEKDEEDQRLSELVREKDLERYIYTEISNFPDHLENCFREIEYSFLSQVSME